MPNSSQERQKKDQEFAYIMSTLPTKVHGDIEAIHVEADKFLEEILVELGYTETVLAYQRLQKWYA